MNQVGQLMHRINDVIINPLIGLLFTVAFVIFLWGAVSFIFNASDAEAQKKGKKNMVWGILGMFIMVSVIAILSIVLRTFGVDTLNTGRGFF